MSTTSNKKYLSTQMQKFENVNFGGIKRCSEEPMECQTMRKMPKLEPIYNVKPCPQLPREENEQKPIKLIISRDRITNAELKQEIVVSKPTQTEDIIVWPDFLKSKIEFLEQTFNNSFAKILKSDEDQFFLAFQGGDSSIELYNGEILRFVAIHVDQFREFAHLQR